MGYYFSCKPDCENRKPGCHDHCEKYQREKAERDKRLAADRIDRGIRNYICEAVATRKDFAEKKRMRRRGNSATDSGHN